MSLKRGKKKRKVYYLLANLREIFSPKYEIKPLDYEGQQYYLAKGYRSCGYLRNIHIAIDSNEEDLSENPQQFFAGTCVLINDLCSKTIEHTKEQCPIYQKHNDRVNPCPHYLKEYPNTPNLSENNPIESPLEEIIDSSLV